MQELNQQKIINDKIHDLLTTSIQKISQQIQKTGLPKVHKSQNFQQLDRSPQKIDIVVQKLQKIEIHSTHSRMLQSRNSTINYPSPNNASRLTYKFDEKIAQEELNQKAKHFINQIRSRKKEVQGKFILRKVAQEHRKKQQQKKLQVQQQVSREIDKQIRKLKAQKNIQFFKQKRKLYTRNVNSHSPTKNRPSNSKAQSRNGGLLPSIYSSQLEQIQEVPTRRKSPSLQRTVLKNKKRSHTMVDIRDDDTDNNDSVHQYHYNLKKKKQEEQEQITNQLKLFNLDQKKGHKSRYSEHSASIDESTDRKISPNSPKRTRNTERDRPRYFLQSRVLQDPDDDQKSYLMTRNKTEDISIYLQRYSNINQIRQSTISIGKSQRGRHRLAKSSINTDMGQLDKEDYEEDE